MGFAIGARNDSVKVETEEEEQKEGYCEHAQGSVEVVVFKEGCGSRGVDSHACAFVVRKDHCALREGHLREYTCEDFEQARRVRTCIKHEVQEHT